MNEEIKCIDENVFIYDGEIWHDVTEHVDTNGLEKDVKNESSDWELQKLL